jgi:hypothetical protein
MVIPEDQILNTQPKPCGTGRLFLSIGGISCAIISHDADFLDLLRSRYQWFETSGPGSYEILVRLVSPVELKFEDIEKNSPPVIRRANGGDNYIMKRADNPFIAVVNTSSRKVLVKMWHSEYCFDSFFRILFTLVLATEGGLMLHASAISEGERGKVFFGPSGSGKTTVAGLAAGRTILTDELVIIKPQDGRYWAYGTPFWGEFTPGRSNTRAELTGLYSLKKDGKSSLMPMDRARAVAELYQCVLFFSDDSNLLSRVLDTCCKLVEAVPVGELHFLPDPSFWQVIGGQS